LGKPVLGLGHKGTFISKPGTAAVGIGLKLGTMLCAEMGIDKRQ
jgi:hypothetical protein